MSKRESRLVSFYSSVIKLNRIAGVILLCAAFVSLAPKCSAQVLYGSLTGNVTDPTKAAVPGAQVEALNVATGVARQSSTDDAGVYRFGELLPGITRSRLRPRTSAQKLSRIFAWMPTTLSALMWS